MNKRVEAPHSTGEGERKPVTILFADIVGSTAIAEQLDPEEWKEILSSAHHRVSEAIERYDGTIAQLLGDGVLAFFGAPTTHEDDPIRATHAALGIQKAIAEYERELDGIIDQFKMRIGINSGTVVIGEIGSGNRMEYLAIGDAVNVAARLQSAAPPGTVILSEPCARLVSAAFDLQDLGEIRAKGKADPLRAFQVLQAKAEPLEGRGIQGLPRSFVGRGNQLETLRSSLLSLSQGHGQIVAVMGHAGIGKTRLVEEVKMLTGRETGDEQGDVAVLPTLAVRWLEGRALSYGGSLSFWTITQLILADLDLPNGTPSLKLKIALRRRLAALFGEKEASHVLPYLAQLLGIKEAREAGSQIQAADGEAWKRGTLESVARYFRQVATQMPTVLILEDLHWADPSSLETLEHLFPLTDRVPLMLLMLMRVDRDHRSWQVKIRAESEFPHRYTGIHLHRLSEGESARLLEDLLATATLPDRIRHAIMARSEGNPFYLEEVVRHLMEQRLIIRDEEGWHGADELETIGIPDTLQGVLLARIDRLEEDVRRTLQIASVIGKSFLYRILTTISEAETHLDAHLSQLQRADLVRERSRLPELEYIFKHALTREAAYQSLLLERRKAFHLQVGQALEELFADRVGEFLGLMAHHFEAAEAYDRALDYLQRAGDQARLAYAHQEAIDFYRRALSILQEQGVHDQAARTLMKIGLTHYTAFDFERSRQAFDQAFAMRQREGIPRQEPPAQAPHPLRVVWGRPPTLDPSIAGDGTSAMYIEGVFSGLVEFGVGWQILPDVAKSWQVSEDGLRYLFQLRDDV